MQQQAKVPAIERGMPIPSPRISRHGVKWSEMKVGDSRLFPTQEGARAAYAWGYKHNATFVTRKTEEGYRVWRTA